MKETSDQSRTMLAWAVRVALLCALCGGASAQQVEGWIYKIGDPRPLPAQDHPGKIRWRASSKEYALMDPATSVTLPIKLEEVQRVQAKKPAGLDQAIEQVKNRQYDPAIPVLEKTVDDYLMCQYDVVAAEALTQAYNAQKRYADTVRVVDKVSADKPAHMITVDLEQAYWRALLEKEDFAKLNEQLEHAIAEGARDVAAGAQNMRGDIFVKKGDPKTALLDGYLRTVVLFQDQKEQQPEALFKAMECFEKLGQNGNREKMRKRLLSDYPQSAYASRVK